jgi:hypothetical protein
MEGTPPPKTWYVSNPGGGNGQGPFTINDILQAIKQGKVTSTRTICNTAGSDKSWHEAGNFGGQIGTAFAPFKVWYVSKGAGAGSDGPFTKETIVKNIANGTITSSRRLLHSSDKNKWADASAWSAFNDAFAPFKVWYVAKPNGGGSDGPFTKETIVKNIADGTITSSRRLLHSSDKNKWADASAWSAFNDAFAPFKVWYVAKPNGEGSDGPFTKEALQKFAKEGKMDGGRKICNVKVDKNKWAEARTWSSGGSKMFFA